MARPKGPQHPPREPTKDPVKSRPGPKGPARNPGPYEDNPPHTDK